MDDYAAGDRVQLAALRALNWADVTDPLERARVLTVVARRLGAMADEQARVAAAAGESMGRIGKALGLSRQGAWRRYASPPDDDSAAA